MDDMGCFYIDLEVENVSIRGVRQAVARVLVDTGSEHTWLSGVLLDELGVTREYDASFVMADGRTIERSIGYAIVHVNGRRTVDDIVFGEADDLPLLGARSLEGLNLLVDAKAKRLVAAGPFLAAAAA
jgi:predicted aspartyl protease